MSSAAQVSPEVLPTSGEWQNLSWLHHECRPTALNKRFEVPADPAVEFAQVHHDPDSNAYLIYAVPTDRHQTHTLYDLQFIGANEDVPALLARRGLTRWVGVSYATKKYNQAQDQLGLSAPNPDQINQFGAIMTGFYDHIVADRMTAKREDADG